MRSVPLIDYSGLDPTVRQQLAEAIAVQTTLEGVLAWTRQQQPRLAVETILTQDEYTHDVLVPYEGGRYLVYDTT